MINFYRRYIPPNCAEIVAPITELTKNKMPNVVKWGDKQEEAFTKIKECLSSEPILKLPDLNREFILQTDASNQSLGGCLLQMHGGVKHPVFYASKKLIPGNRIILLVRGRLLLLYGRSKSSIVICMDSISRLRAIIVH